MNPTPSLAYDHVMLTVPQAVEHFGIPLKTLHKMVRSGEIQSRRRGHLILVRRASVIAWIEGREGPAPLVEEERQDEPVSLTEERHRRRDEAVKL